MKNDICYFEFAGKVYPSRSLKLGREWGDVVVSVQSLNAMLINEKGQYPSAAAERLDEKIFFFVDDEDIDKPTKHLVKKVLKEVA